MPDTLRQLRKINELMQSLPVSLFEPPSLPASLLALCKLPHASSDSHDVSSSILTSDGEAFPQESVTHLEVHAI